MTEHHTTIERNTRVGLMFRRIAEYQMECTCGAVGAPRRNVSLAIADADMHRRMTAPPEHVETAVSVSEPEAAPQPKEKTVNPLFEMFVVPTLGFVITSNQAHIDHLVDNAADKIIEAVNDSETQIDDVAAAAFASTLVRLATRVRAGVAK